MRKCAGKDTENWGHDAIYDVACLQCGTPTEFFLDEITRTCSTCGSTVKSDRTFHGCGQNCSSNSTHRRNLCPKFKRSKHRFVGNSTV